MWPWLHRSRLPFLTPPHPRSSGHSTINFRLVSWHQTGTQKLAIPRIIRVESRTLKRRQFDRKSFYHSHDTAITANILIGPFTNFTSAASSTEQEAWEFLWPSDRFCLIGDILYDYRSEWSVDFTRYNVSLATHLTLPPFKTMNPPLRSYYFSPLNDKINSSKCSHLSSHHAF